MAAGLCGNPNNVAGRQLHAGPFTVYYENGFLRYIRYGEAEILRMIYFALRDENWGTDQLHIENEQISIQNDSFSIQYASFHRKNDVNVFRWDASIKSYPAGMITFEIIGTALTDILKNRAGFCVLHPIKEALCQPCRIIHPDESVSYSIFPELVTPENPFKDIKEFHWAIAGNWFELEFEGDVFETEDQRNWTDASFKTFCTPLVLPFPVALRKGDRVHQKITFRSGALLPAIQEKESRTNVATGIVQRIPFIGIAASTETDGLNSKAIVLLRTLKLSHYRVEVYPLQVNWVTKFSNDCRNAHALELPLEVALHLTDSFEKEIDAFVMIALQNRIHIRKIILLSESQLVTNQTVIDSSPGIKAQLQDTQIGAGTDYNFTELNRNRFLANTLDFISFSIDPQEHAFDDLSLFENIEAQLDVVKSAQQMYKGVPIHISPLTLRRRYNPYTKSEDKRVLTNEGKSDPRQPMDFTAAWTMKSLNQLASAGVHAVTLYQTVGKQGIMSIDGQPYPVYLALRDLLSQEF